MVRQTTIVTAVQLLRLFIQGMYFLVLTRLLAPSSYGIFITVVGATAILSPLCGPGAGELLIKSTARRAATFRLWFGHAVTAILLSFPALAIVLSAALWMLIPEGGGPILFIGVATADLLFLRMADVMGQAFQSRERIIGYAVCGLAVPVARLIGLGALALSGFSLSLEQWGAFYCAMTALGASANLIAASRLLGHPKLFRLLPRVRAGLPFALNTTIEHVATDLDKLILISFLPPEQAGLYAAGQRIVELATSPVRSLFASYYPKYFKAPGWERDEILFFTKSVLKAGVATGSVLGLLLVISVPLIPFILGAEYRGASEVVLYLAAAPILFVFIAVPADLLSGLGRQSERTLMMGSAVFTQVMFNLVFIPKFGWQAAALDMVLCFTALAFGCWARVIWLLRSDQTNLALSRK
jgi:O-antigen/teichoic acid export membrane protein